MTFNRLENASPDIAKSGSMLVYVSSVDGKEYKFGDAWAKEGEDKNERARQRIRQGMAQWRQKRLSFFWYTDISSFAKKHDKFYARSKIDDTIRSGAKLRGRLVDPVTNTLTEIHKGNPEKAVEKILAFLREQNAPGRKLELSTAQSDALKYVRKSIKNDNKTIASILCPRFGKTPWALELARQEKSDIIIIASYVDTVYASFRNDILEFANFRNMVFVDCRKEDYKEKINKALREGKQVVAYLSLVKGKLRQDRIDFLFNKRKSRTLIIDEADFGAHRINQAKPLYDARKKMDTVILMTGSNGERSVSLWEPDIIFGTTYFELLWHKKNPKNNRDKLYSSLNLYRGDMGPLVDRLVSRGVSENELPSSWLKLAEFPAKAKGALFVPFLEGVFLGKHGLDNMNVDLQTNSVPDRRVAMLWLPGGRTKNKHMNDLCNIAKEVLPGWNIILLCGDKQVNGRKVTNKNAEDIVKEVLEENDKPVLILSSRLGERSFSVSEITELHICYDGGQEGSTLQKISRALTSNQTDKTANIFNWSFDPNRDDKFIAFFVDGALKSYQKTNGVDYVTRLREIYSSVPLFDATVNGPIRVTCDQAIQEAMERRVVDRVIGNSINLKGIPENILKDLAKGVAEYARAEKQNAATKGKISPPTVKESSGKSDEQKKFEQRVRENIVMISENSYLIKELVGAQSLSEAMKKLTKEDKDIIATIFEIPFSSVKWLWDNKLNKAYHDVRSIIQ